METFPVVLLAIMSAFVLLYPAAQVIYFSGGLLRMWTASGWTGAGILVTTLLGAVLTLDWHFLPVAVVVSLCIALITLWTRSLLAPLLAMLILSHAVAGTTFGVAHGLAIARFCETARILRPIRVRFNARTTSEKTNSVNNTM